MVAAAEGEERGGKEGITQTLCKTVESKEELLVLN
jgi:hypothetical protein